MQAKTRGRRRRRKEERAAKRVKSITSHVKTQLQRFHWWSLVTGGHV